MPAEYPDHERFQEGGRECRNEGATLASPAGLIVPTHRKHIVSGTNAITGITLPYASFRGSIEFMPTGAFTWTTATNIAVAGTAVVARTVTFSYLQSTAKWYPSYV